MKSDMRNIKKLISDLNKRGKELVKNSKKNMMAIDLKQVNIKMKICVLVMALLVVSIFILSILANNISRNSIKTKVASYTESIMHQITLNAEQKLKSIESIANKIIQSDAIREIEGLGKVEDDVEYYQLSTSILAKFTELIKSSPYIESISYIYDDKNKEELGALPQYILADDRKKTRDKYTAMAKSDNKTQWTYLKESANGAIHIAMVMPVINKNTNNFMGTMAIICKKGIFVDSYNDIAIGSGSKIYTQSTDGVLLGKKNDVELNSQYIGNGFMKELMTYVIKGKSYYDFNGENATDLVVFSKIPDTDVFNIGIIPSINFNKYSNKMIFPLALISVVCVLLGSIILSILIKSIILPLRKFADYIKVVGKGDLSYRVEDKGNDEIAEINRSFGVMCINISELVHNVRTLASNIHISSEKINELSNNSECAVIQVASTMEEVSKGAESQAFGLTNGSTMMESLAGSIDEITNKISQVSNVIDETKKTIEGSITTIKVLNDKAKDTDVFARQIITEVNNLDEDMKEIKSIIEMIANVSEQTNLLSLNAAIEASRAGQAGGGFSVVAGEVRRLAHQTKDASAKITSIIDEIKFNTEKTSSKAMQSSDIVKEQMAAVDRTTKTFTIMHETMNGVNEKIQRMRDSVNNILDLKQDTMSMMEGISAISQETMSITENVSASAQEQTVGIQQLGELIAHLTKLQNQLNSSTENIKISCVEN